MKADKVTDKEMSDRVAQIRADRKDELEEEKNKDSAKIKQLEEQQKKLDELNKKMEDQQKKKEISVHQLNQIQRIQ